MLNQFQRIRELYYWKILLTDSCHGEVYMIFNDVELIGKLFIIILWLIILYAIRQSHCFQWLVFSNRESWFHVFKHVPFLSILIGKKHYSLDQVIFFQSYKIQRVKFHYRCFLWWTLISTSSVTRLSTWLHVYGNHWN